MRQTLLRTVLRKEVVGLARFTVIILSIFLFLLEFGYRADAATSDLLDQLSYGLVAAASFVTFSSLSRTYLRGMHLRKAELAWFMAALILIVAKPLGLEIWGGEYRWPHLLFLFFFVFIELSRLELGRNSVLFNPALLFTTSFALLIAIGSGLLMLPNAATRPLATVDALFTATSAVCITGLSTINVGQDLTFQGQCVLLLLIQIGGLGVMTFTSFFAFFFKGRNSLEEQLRVRDISNTSLGNARSFVVQVILFTLSVELVGMVFIFFSVPEEIFGSFGDRVFFSVFHSISAFNNAGFSTQTLGIYELPFRFNYSLMWVLATLFIFGGLGFSIIFNFSRYTKLWIIGRVKQIISGIRSERHPRLVNLSSRLALQVTSVLIAVGTMAVLVFEWNGALAEHTTWWGRFTMAFFTGVTPRTAGFNAVDYSTLKIPTLMVTLLLMYVGASPGSTGGGIKTTTLGIATLNIFATARGRRRVEYGGREISNLTLRRAFAAIVLSLIFLGLAISILASLELSHGLLPIAFECFSAFSTVGLTMGITATLGSSGKLVLVMLMFVGRVSALTLLVGVLRQVQVTPYRYPKEDLLIN